MVVVVRLLVVVLSVAMLVTVGLIVCVRCLDATRLYTSAVTVMSRVAV